MAAAKITGQGLAVIAVLVCLLWACVIAERLTVARAAGENERNLRLLNRLRVAMPALRTDTAKHTPRVTL